MDSENIELLIRDEQRINQQLRDGMSLVFDLIRQLSQEFDCPAMSECSFLQTQTHIDFDCDYYSIVDSQHRVVRKLSKKDLMDSVSPGTQEVKKRLEAKLRAALMSHFNVRYFWPARSFEPSEELV